MHNEDTKVFGFWIYLMTDLIVFAVLFAAFLVLRNNTFGGPSGYDLFHMPFALTETLLLLTSSFTCSLATYSLYTQRKSHVIFWFFITTLLGLSFIYLELFEFTSLVAGNNSWQRSAFLSAFFGLVGTHGFHVSIGLLWMVVTIVTLFFRELSPEQTSRILRVAYFWHFLDVVWIFIFTVVYGMGHLNV